MHKYRSLAAWQAAHELVIRALRMTDGAAQPRNYALFDQIRRAVISAEANIVEGYAPGSTAQFRRHLRIALGSAAEAESLIRVAGEMSYLPENEVAELAGLTGRVIRAVHGLIKTELAHPMT